MVVARVSFDSCSPVAVVAKAEDYPVAGEAASTPSNALPLPAFNFSWTSSSSSSFSPSLSSAESFNPLNSRGTSNSQALPHCTDKLPHHPPGVQPTSATSSPR